MKKLLILQTVAPDYRKKVYTHIKQKLNDDFILLCGNTYFEDSVKTDDSIDFIKRVKNHYFFRRQALFQTGMWSEVLKAHTVVLEMNPRIFSNWLILFLRKPLKKNTVLWGHAWPRNGVNSRSDYLRNLMRGLADIIVVYTKTQAKELGTKMPSKTILSAPNAVFSAKEMEVSEDKDIINNIIYVGRLTENKKPLFLVKAFLGILNELPQGVKLIIVGDGDEKGKISRFVKENNLKDKVILKGHISEYNALKSLYNSSLLSVSPGYVGLSITQSFGFGVPMLISKDENHSPEIEAALENDNSLFFKTDCIDNLGGQILLFFKTKEYWVNHRKEICNFCKSNYTVEVMANTFINIYKR